MTTLCVREDFRSRGPAMHVEIMELTFGRARIIVTDGQTTVSDFW